VGVVRDRGIYYGLVIGLAVAGAGPYALWHEGVGRGNWLGGVGWFVICVPVGLLIARRFWRAMVYESYRRTRDRDKDD
jgi:hypothetical protein